MSAQEPVGDTFKRIFWNGVAPLADNGGANIVGTGIKAGQEVIYSKVIRKFMKSDNRSWMSLVIFSLLTSAFDEGMGAFLGEHKASADQGFTDVLKEFPRPVLSCIAVNWIMATSYMGFHNPMRTFGFKELLIQLAAKDIAEGGNAILAQKMDNAKDKIALLNNLSGRQYASSRLKAKTA